MKSILNLALDRTGESLEDIENAIDKSEENSWKYYYVRGLVAGKRGEMKAAIEDFSIVRFMINYLMFFSLVFIELIFYII